jgi:hypothetical protein
MNHGCCVATRNRNIPEKSRFVAITEQIKYKLRTKTYAYATTTTINNNNNNHHQTVLTSIIKIVIKIIKPSS